MIFGPTVQAEVSANIMLRTAVPAAIEITKTETGSESGSINPRDGSHTGLSAIFNIQTNGDDTDFDVILSSSVNAGGSILPAICQNGNAIVFVNTTADVSPTDVNNAKSSSASKNVIAYPFTVSPSDPMSATYQASLRTYTDCYQILLNSAEEGTVTCEVGATPVSGTYNVGLDQSGTYQATVTLTAVGK